MGHTAPDPSSLTCSTSGCCWMPRPSLRGAQLIEREGEDYREEWNARWDEAEQWYFGNVMPPESFDLVIPAE